MQNIEEILEYISPSALSYQEWLSVGMALKNGGFDVSVWDSWSQADSRYKPGECAKKWKTFGSVPEPVTIGTIIKMAKENGCFKPKTSGKRLAWNDEIVGKDGSKTTSCDPQEQNPVNALMRYISALFKPEDIIAYNFSSFEKDGRFCPKGKGIYVRKMGEIFTKLEACNGDITQVFGDYDPKAGAWIRLNPFDGNGIKDENVTAFRHVLVECDNIPLDEQERLIRQLKLPVATLVYSGGKSLHAAVKIDAENAAEYRERVRFLYEICKKNGLEIDTANKNPSRLSRIPGVRRGDKKQFLIDTDIGAKNWEEWLDFAENILEDELPAFENMADFWDNMPELSPPLIDGVLRQGHKMLLAGPSKAGKSFALIELAIAIAEGRKWLGWECAKGKVLYINLELDSASCKQRFKLVAQKMGLKSINRNVLIWNLRGHAKTIDKLLSALFRLAENENLMAVIIDPIYKVITGDENSASEMAYFCNQFDKICKNLNCATIYCHHHSKGLQGGKKSMDRASGSGVFARDPDALIDMTELTIPETVREQLKHDEKCRIFCRYLQKYAPEIYEKTDLDDLDDIPTLAKICGENLSREIREKLTESIAKAESRAGYMTALRVEGTLREFPYFEPKNVWFRYPLHEVDSSGTLKNLHIEAVTTTRKYGALRGHQAQSQSAEEVRREKNEEIENVLEIFGGTATIEQLADAIGASERTVRRRIEESDAFSLERGIVAKV